MPLQEMLDIEALDEDTVTELRTRAKDALLTLEIAQESGAQAEGGLLHELAGMTPELMDKLAAAGIHTRDDLADLGTDELMEITAQSSDEANALIMKAREHWFDKDQA